MNAFIKTLFIGLIFLVANSNSSALPERDLRGDKIVDLNTPRTFPEINNLSEWKKCAQDIRTQVHVSAGLYPMMERPPVKATVFGKTIYKDFSVEKVYIESLPGFYLCGNLYRPVDKGSVPLPAILNPHGHWKNGRLEDSETGSIPARCISFARMGMIAFSYDMVGYNDTVFRSPGSTTGYSYHRMFGTNDVDQLWGISLMGLQLWDSVRALDFVMSLPDVDKTRIGCTGASGGGTQTFMLGAADDRLAVLAPTVMVSHSMQGGCSCENMPGLRIEYSNMEIAAVPAPKPQIFIAAKGDWTKTFMTIEGPSIARIYGLFKQTNRIYYEVLPFEHNYNKTTREAVYSWFGKWFLKQNTPYKEEPYPAVSNLDLRVFPDNRLPDNTVTVDELRQWMMKNTTSQFNSLLPKDKSALNNYKNLMTPAWRHTLQVQSLGALDSEQGNVKQHNKFIERELFIGIKGRGDRIPITVFEPDNSRNKTMAILVHPSGRKGFLDDNGMPVGIAADFIGRGFPVLLLDLFGNISEIKTAAKRNYFANFFTTYNRTDCQERVGDILVAVKYAKSKGYKALLYGYDRAGLWTMLASPSADVLIADANQFNSNNDNVLLVRDLFVPGIRRIGGFEGVLTLSAPSPLLLYNTGEFFTTDTLRKVYKDIGSPDKITIFKEQLGNQEIIRWVVSKIF